MKKPHINPEPEDLPRTVVQTPCAFTISVDTPYPSGNGKHYQRFSFVAEDLGTFLHEVQKVVQVSFAMAEWDMVMAIMRSDSKVPVPDLQSYIDQQQEIDLRTLIETYSQLEHELKHDTPD